MSRVFIGNFDFEHRLAAPDAEPAANIKRLNAELATSWLAIADSRDFIWTPSAIDRRFFEDAADLGLPRVTPVTSLSEVPPDAHCVPWGWSADVRQLAYRLGWSAIAPPMEVVQLANSRKFSFELEEKWNLGLPESRRIEKLEQFIEATGTEKNPDRRWVVKAEFSMSGRERILGRGAPTEPQINWVRKRLVNAGTVFFEPWVDRIEEAGIQFEISPLGYPRLIGVTPMMVDARGQYAGSIFHRSIVENYFNQQKWSEAIDAGRKAAIHLQSCGYFGPLGIDAMRYRDPDGTIRIRPLQDINARWTMGRLSLGFCKLLAAGEQGYWQHGANLDIQTLPFTPKRIISTSPNVVDDQICRHQSRVLIGAADSA